MPIPLGIFAVAGAGGPAAGPAMELISSQILTSAAASVTFSSIPQTFKHLQVRLHVASTRSQADTLRMRFNSDDGANYAVHQLRRSVSTVVSESVTSTNSIFSDQLASEQFNSITALVSDILDYSSTTKNTTTRQLHGMVETGGFVIRLTSGLYVNTAAITSITFSASVGPNLANNTRFSLYGIRG